MANLLSVLEKNSAGITDTIIYGYVDTAIERPYYLRKDDIKVTTKGFFAKIDVLAVKCNKQDYFSDDSGLSNPQSIYFIKGDLVIYMTDPSLIGKNVKVMGSAANRPTKIKRQFGAKELTDGVNALVWSKVPGGAWGIAPNYVVPLCSRDVKGTVLEEYVINISNMKGFTQPASVNSEMPFNGVNSKDLTVIPYDKLVDTNKTVVKQDKVDNKINLKYKDGLVDLSALDLKLRHQLEVKFNDEILDSIGDVLDTLRGKSKDFVMSLNTGVRRALSEDGVNEGLKTDALSMAYTFLTGVVKGYSNIITSKYKWKGSVIVDSFIDSLGVATFGVTVDNRKEFNQQVDTIRKNVAFQPEVLDPQNINLVTFGDIRVYSLFVIGECSGVGVEKLNSCFNSMKFYNELNDIDEFYWCVRHNPYLLGMLGNLSLVDCDTLQVCFGKENLSKSEELRNARGLLLMLNAVNDVSDRDTVVRKTAVLSQASKYNANAFKNYTQTGCILGVDYCDVVSIVSDNNLAEISKAVMEFKYSKQRAFADLIEYGIVETLGEKDVLLQTDLYKEYTILTKLIEKGSTKTGITDKEVKETIKTFEGSCGFKLESLQKDAINLIKYKAGVLSGCAGSGKTTTSDCMVMGLKNYLPDVVLKYGAPTGKAAKRLSEVVGGNVKTLHSLFGIGLDSEPCVKINHTGRKFKSLEGGAIAYIFDEMAMCNTSLLYNVVLRLRDMDMVYFLGDIKQLPPIGKGSPFRALMQLLPCIELGVSKRAAEGSKINYNCGLINFVSDGEVAELTPGDDFEIVSCKDDAIAKHTVDVFRGYLGRYKEDEIQVISGYQSEKYAWSTKRLNPMLQLLLRDQSERLYVYNNKEFMVNDRVIHTNRNAYEMPRFRLRGKTLNQLEEVVTFGVVNGEVGKILGVVNSSKVDIEPWFDPSYSKEELEGLDESYREAYLKRINTQVDIRSEHTLKDEKIVYVVVQVYDVDLCEDVVILYRGTERKAINTDYNLALSGWDMGLLELAYALTCHKMQGSQSKAVIVPLGSKGSPEFMNRNMINTMITRSSEQVCLLGSVTGSGSALTQGRRYTSNESGKDLLGMVVETNDEMNSN